MMFTPPCNLPTSEYAVGIGWTLPVGSACKVCQQVVTLGDPHAVDCKRPDPRMITMDTTTH